MFGRFLIFLYNIYNWNCLGTVPFIRMTFQGQSFAEAWIFAFFWSKKLSGCSSFPGCSSHSICNDIPMFPHGRLQISHSISQFFPLHPYCTAMSRDVDGFHWSILWELWMVAKSPVDRWFILHQLIGFQHVSTILLVVQDFFHPLYFHTFPFWIWYMFFGILCTHVYPILRLR